MKKYLFVCIVLGLIGIGLIPLNLMAFAFAEYVTLIAAVLMLVALVIFFIKVKRKILSKTLLSLFTVLSISFTLFGAYCNPYWNSMMFKTYEYTEEPDQSLMSSDAKADLAEMMYYLEKDHPLFINGTPDDVQSVYDDVVAEVMLQNTITVTELQRKMQRILSLLGDAHTCTFTNFEKYHYLKYYAQRRDGGYRLTKINDITLEDLLEQNKQLYSYETEAWGLIALQRNLMSLEGLQFLQLLPNGIKYTYTDKDGKEDVAVYNESDFVTLDEYYAFNNMQATTTDKPFVSFTIEEDKKVATLTLTQCNYNDEYRKCLKDMFSEIKAKDIDKVVVDIRKNPGGSSLVVNEFIRYLNVDTYKTDTSVWRFGKINLPCGDGVMKNEKFNDLTFDGDVYLLTSSESFSSAMMFAQYIKDNDLGTLIGEAPANTPTGYGDIATFMLPNSKLYFQVSTKTFTRADSKTTDLLVMPDVPCPANEAMTVFYEKFVG